MYDANYLATRLAAGSAENRDAAFLVLPDLDRHITYKQFFAGSERIARLLSDRGLAAGDRVLVYAPKSATSLELYFGCLIAGFVYVSINPGLPIDNMSYFLSDVEPKAVVCGEKDRVAMAREAEGSGAHLFTLDADETGTLIDARNAVEPGFQAVPREAADIAAILYTSGTTGKPKGAVHTHHSLWSNAEALVASWKFARDDVLIHALPIFHLHGLFTATNVVLASGGSCRYLPRFEPKAVLDEMPVSTALMGVPPFYMQLLETRELEQAAKNMRVFISGSAPMLPQTHRAWHERTGKTIIERYGMTECSMIASNPYDEARKPNTVGFPLPGVTVRITDVKSGETVENGHFGMIEIKGPNLFREYWNKPEKTAADHTEDGFFISGDFGRYDADGYLSVLCRVKDAVFTSEGTVLPKEVEEILDEDAAVAESAVISVPTPSGSAAPVAILVANPGAQIDTERLKSAVDAKLDAFKQPVRYIPVGTMPRNAMGKVQKAALRETYATCLETADEKSCEHA
ncbi:malonyl-CoA synthase [Fulvimarina pelagi HTCC2506]|uniref:Malonyl-CoA synthase n=1 Tax=Fulvimarina pelagi HTCC2506 TaxID=314231 RepID=Q0G3G3_9HYPH|nr:AMP-binding protein [Fulvimarina pelagi]EAU41868.1 malonyl-CoA synthase [Fulvimarina pelagi HTCC2506]